MDEILHTALLKNTEELRELLRPYSTASIVAACAVEHLRLGCSEDDVGLTAEVRQIFFSLCLMLTTPQPRKPKIFGHDEWRQAANLLNQIFHAYGLMFWPARDELPTLIDDRRRAIEVAMPAFLHYFTTGLIASVEQVIRRIQMELVPFDSNLKSRLGLDASDALRVAGWIAQSLQGSVDDLCEAISAEYAARQAFLSEARKGGWDVKRMRVEAQKHEYGRCVERVACLVEGQFKCQLESLRSEFGVNLAGSYWNQFVSVRGGVSGFTYLTERNIAEERPLFQLEDGIAMCAIGNALYTSILLVGERCLLESNVRNSFLKRRDRVLEEESERVMRLIFGDSATFLRHVYETPDLQNEHDLVIVWNRNLFVVEAKAAPPTEPFRDPEKAFVRIKRAFRSERGIQKAYEQASRVRSCLRTGHPVSLYDTTRALAATLEPSQIDDVYCVCVTRDDFGPLAVDLSLLLEKPEDDAYPWAVNILDLEHIADAWSYFRWGPQRLCEYLNDRCKLHGKVFAPDELEIAGFFIRHGALTKIVEADSDRVFLTPDYSDVFDEIYLARRGGPEVVYSPSEPSMDDMRQMIADTTSDMGPSQELTKDRRNAKRPGRNEPCPCGSGKKYKRCCGRAA